MIDGPWFVAELLVSFFEIVLIFKYLAVFFERKYNVKLERVWIIVLSGLSFASTIIDNTSITKILVYLIVTLAVMVLYEGFYYKKILRWFTLFIIIIGIENIILFAMMIAFNQPIPVFAQNTIYRLVAVLASKIVLLYFVVWTESKMTKDYAAHLNPNLIILALSFFFTVIAGMVILLKMYESNFQVLGIANLLILCLTLICWLAIFIYEIILKLSQKLIETNLLNQQKYYEIKYAETVEDAVDEMKRLRHDFSNHMNCIMGFLGNELYDDLIKYVEKLADPFYKIDEIIVTDNSTISAIIYAKYLIAKGQGIELVVKSDYESPVLIQNIELCILIGNVLDNAIEACRKNEKNKRTITLRIRTRKNWLMIDCENYVDVSHLIIEKGNYITNKFDKSIHGYGLKNIKTVVDKYNGNMHVEVDSDKFIINLTLSNN